MPRQQATYQDMWGLNGPPTSRVIDVDRQIFLRHSLAFQCVVNIGVRGSETIRTRVVQAGALDLVAQILETWLIMHDISIFAGPIGSQSGVRALAAGLPVPGTQGRRPSRTTASRIAHAVSLPGARASIANFVSSLTQRNHEVAEQANTTATDGETASVRSDARTGGETDVDMAEADADADVEDGTDGASTGVGDDSMDVDRGRVSASLTAGPSATPRATSSLAPYSDTSRSTSRDRLDPSQASSVANSVSGDEAAVSAAIPRATSDNNLGATARPTHLNLNNTRMPQLGQDTISNQSSPMGTPIRQENAEGMRPPARRGTIIGRPVTVNLAPRNERWGAGAGSGTSDGGDDVDLPTATIAAGIAAANAQAMEGGGTVVPDEPGPPPNVEIVEGGIGGAAPEEPDPEMVAAEQARLDMEAGAPPGQPGAAQTPRVPNNEAQAPQNQPTDPAATQAQIIIANGAPRGFQDLGSYVGISAILNPTSDRYSDDSVLLALQLLAYLSKYPRVRSAFHHPNRPMHPTFDLNASPAPLHERPMMSHVTNMFSLVERFTFRPSPSDPLLYNIPEEVQYWAGVIMRNACRKDDAKGGTRQCAHMPCGKWESFPREFAKCRKCRKAKYCSKQCQSAAWSEGHRFWCSTRSDDVPPGAGAGPSGRPPRDPHDGGGDDDDHDGDEPRPPRGRTGSEGAGVGGDGTVRLRGMRASDDPMDSADDSVAAGQRGATDQLPLDFQRELLNEVNLNQGDRPRSGLSTGTREFLLQHGGIYADDAQGMTASGTLPPDPRHIQLQQTERHRRITADVPLRENQI